MKAQSIELRVWRQFIAVAEELHFGRAARRLHMTQPPLTYAIAQLEETLGVQLFERTRRTVRLSQAGEALLPDVRELLAHAAHLPEQARAAAGGEIGRLRLAFVSTVGYTFLPQWLRAFRVAYPRVQLELTEATGDLQLQAFDRGEVDAGFVLHSPGFPYRGLAHRQVAREPMALAIPEEHPLASSKRLTLLHVMREPLIMFPRRAVPSLHDALYAMYQADGCVPIVSQEAVQMQTIVNLVSAGLGLAWVPASMLRFSRSGVVYRELKGKQAERVPKCDTTLAWRAGSPTAERFAAFTRGLASATLYFNGADQAPG
jgi:DNA-binding transcriptional LysR family regulator